jgi:hypothetical protein
VLHIKMINIGNVPQTLDDSARCVYDSHRRKYDADSEADIDANNSNGGGVSLNDINPGNTVRGVILSICPRAIGVQGQAARLRILRRRRCQPGAT